MPYAVWWTPGGNEAEREHVQSYPDASQARPDMDYLKQRLPPTDTITGNWATVPADAKPFDWSRCREPENTPSSDATPTAVQPLW